MASPFVNWIADFLVQDEAHRGVDHVFLLFASAAQHQAGNSDLLALDAAQQTRWTGSEEQSVLRLRQGRGSSIILGRRPVA